MPRPDANERRVIQSTVGVETADYGVLHGERITAAINLIAANGKKMASGALWRRQRVCLSCVTRPFPHAGVHSRRALM